MTYIQTLSHWLGSGWFGISSISVEECVSEGESCNPAVVPVSQAPCQLESCTSPMIAVTQVLTKSRSRASVRGRFHQADKRFWKYGGVQCMAISLVALVRHTLTHWSRSSSWGMSFTHP